MLFVDAPFVFKPMWQLVRPLLKSYASLVCCNYIITYMHFFMLINSVDLLYLFYVYSCFLILINSFFLLNRAEKCAYFVLMQVRFCDAETVRKEYFTADTTPPDFRN